MASEGRDELPRSVCVCMYVYFTCVCACVCTRMCVCTHMIYMHICVYVHACVCVHGGRGRGRPAAEGSRELVVAAEGRRELPRGVRGPRRASALSSPDGPPPGGGARRGRSARALSLRELSQSAALAPRPLAAERAGAGAPTRSRRRKMPK